MPAAPLAMARVRAAIAFSERDADAGRRPGSGGDGGAPSPGTTVAEEAEALINADRPSLALTEHGSESTEEFVEAEYVCDKAGVEKRPDEERSVSMSARPSSSSDEYADGPEERSTGEELRSLPSGPAKGEE